MCMYVQQQQCMYVQCTLSTVCVQQQCMCMYVYMCVYVQCIVVVYVYMYVCMCVCVYVCMYTCMCVYVYCLSPSLSVCVLSLSVCTTTTVCMYVYTMYYCIVVVYVLLRYVCMCTTTIVCMYACTTILCVYAQYCGTLCVYIGSMCMQYTVCVCIVHSVYVYSMCVYVCIAHSVCVYVCMCCCCVRVSLALVACARACVLPGCVYASTVSVYSVYGARDVASSGQWLPHSVQMRSGSAVRQIGGCGSRYLVVVRGLVRIIYYAGVIAVSRPPCRRFSVCMCRYVNVVCVPISWIIIQYLLLLLLYLLFIIIYLFIYSLLYVCLLALCAWARSRPLCRGWVSMRLQGVVLAGLQTLCVQSGIKRGGVLREKNFLGREILFSLDKTILKSFLDFGIRTFYLIPSIY